MQFTGRSFRIGRAVSSGAYGTVTRMTWETLSPLRVLCAKSEACFQDRTQAPLLTCTQAKEIAAAAVVSCSARACLHTPRYYCSWAGFDEENCPRLYLCMELMRAFSARRVGVARAVVGMIESLSSLHSAGVIHRDVKPDNFVLDDQGNVRIVDLGLATTVCRNMVGKSRRTIGSSHALWYRAPELHVYALSQKASISEQAADIFALGCCLWHCIVGSHLLDDLRIPCMDTRSFSSAVQIRRRCLRIIAYRFGLDKAMCADVGVGDMRLPLPDVEYLRSNETSDENRVRETLLSLVRQKTLSAERSSAFEKMLPLLSSMLSPCPDRRPPLKEASARARTLLGLSRRHVQRSRAPGLVESRPSGRRSRFNCRMPTSASSIINFPLPGIKRWPLHAVSGTNLLKNPGKAWMGFRNIVHHVFGNFRGSDIPLCEVSVKCCQLYSGLLHHPLACWRSCLRLCGLVVAKSSLGLKDRALGEKEFSVLSACRGVLVDPFPQTSWWNRVGDFLVVDELCDPEKVLRRLRVFFPSERGSLAWRQGRSTSSGRMGFRYSRRDGLRRR